ncbi:MAG: hypothetical protein COA90_09000 [Gammaproteobacteria bacterium]|nr:MAG: hypothetical protein COA90_09000 [Gammaproteobacteria bacterium]
MNTFKLTSLLAVVMMLTACAQHIQTSSGRSYLDKYDHLENKAVEKGKAESVNQLVRKAAMVEPTLTFPARIGIARIDRGYLTSIPDAEIEFWEESRKNIGYKLGEFVPVSPLITTMAVSSVGVDDKTIDVVSQIRIGAARQHMDAVLIYEVYSRENSSSNGLSIGDLTIIGAYLLPSKSVETQGYANALLIDVVQGYPYGTAEASLEKSELASTVGRYDKMQELSKEIKTEVTAKLVKQVEEMFKDLILVL